MNDSERLAGLQTKLANVSGEAAHARAGLANCRKALEDESTTALIEDRKPATEKLRKAVDAAELQLRETEERSALLLKAVTRLQGKIQAERDETAAQQVEALQVKLRPNLSRFNSLVDELAAVSRDLLVTCQQDQAYAHIGPFLGQFLFPSRTGQSDNAAECAFRARILGDIAALAPRVEEKKLRKVG